VIEMTSTDLAEVQLPGTEREPQEPETGVLFEGVTKRYAGNDRLSLDLDRLSLPGGSLTVLVGPSGCGKTTALRIVSGLETPTDGRLFIDGADVIDTPPGRRGVSMVFQDFALYPHLTVEKNISFGLRLQARHDRRSGLDDAEIERRVAQVCGSLGLAALRKRRPAQLSGGERQRVGLARAIVRRPTVLLLDEPLSALDAQLRQRARAELVGLHRELGNTIVLVTHDQLEAMSMATHLVVMNHSKVLQAGSPTEVYRRPVDTFVATFLGSPPMNLSTVGVPAADRLAGPDLEARLPRPVPGLPSEVQLGWRPGDATPVRHDADPRTGLFADGVVELVEFTGDTMVAQCTSASGRWAVVVPANGNAPAVGESLRVHVPAARLHLFDPVTGSRLEAADAGSAHE